MKVGDYVYLYLYDLEKTLVNMNQLREDRFGKIIKIDVLSSSTNNVLVYEIKLLNGKVIKYSSNSLTQNIVSISGLLEIVGRAKIDSGRRQSLLDQINRVLSQ